MSRDSSRYRFKHHPETCDPDDIWGQVKRTVRGKPVSGDQIALILGAIRHGLLLQPDDTLVDLCCGNGGLTSDLFKACRGGVGVDYSAFLIDVAKRRFGGRPTERYLVADALDYVRSEARPRQFTKMVCYGAFPYFDHSAARVLLTTIADRFERVTRVFLGQLPDRERMAAFFNERVYRESDGNDPGSLLGIWRTEEEIAALGRSAGWVVRCARMPDDFFASHYRFDAILTRS